MRTDFIMKRVQADIKAETAELEQEQYIWFMRELSNWCEEQAAMADYGDDLLAAYMAELEQ